MGVPRLFRILVERYPLILRGADAHPQPEFDNFYLDFNGIVHTCTHNNQATMSKTQQEMMMAMFSAIEQLFELVQPKRLLFIAIDGVAPRAKMNQQRQRRFRAAKVREAMKEDAGLKAKQAGQDEVAGGTEPFDSNCITPGTEFMEELDRHLTYFIQRKIDEDVRWRNIDVILSGHRVPGEGEHKIMEFIRSLRSQEGHDPNTRHCLHGLDADLIMLALATHEPHFCILREKMIMRSRYRAKLANDQDTKQVSFQETQEHQYIFIGLLREYIELELSLELQGSPGTGAGDSGVAPANLERLIDDFVFMCFLLGNDFLPHLPTADIDEGGLHSTFEIYRKVRAATRGEYMVNTSTLDINDNFLHLVFKEFQALQPTLFERLIQRYEKALKPRNGKPTKAAGQEPAKPKQPAFVVPPARASVWDKPPSAASAPAPEKPAAPAEPTANQTAIPPAGSPPAPAPAPAPAPEAAPPAAAAPPNDFARVMNMLTASAPPSGGQAAGQPPLPSQPGLVDPAILHAQAPPPPSALPAPTMFARPPHFGLHQAGPFPPGGMPFARPPGQPFPPGGMIGRPPLPPHPGMFFQQQRPMAMAPPHTRPQTAATGQTQRNTLFKFFHPSEVAAGGPAMTPLGVTTQLVHGTGPVRQPVAVAPAAAPTPEGPHKPAAAAEATPSAVPAAAESEGMTSVQMALKALSLASGLSAAEGDPESAGEPGSTDDATAAATLLEGLGTRTPAELEAWYYRKHFWGFADLSDAELARERQRVAISFVRGLKWVLGYYFQGLLSWSWYFPYFAAPLPSDLAGLPTQLKFEIGAPLQPFQQLLAVLPAASDRLLPAPLRGLMHNELKDLYPLEYECIPDAKGREWRDIAVIPFIDEARLRGAFDQVLATTPNALTGPELQRNRLVKARVFRYTPGASVKNESPIPEVCLSKDARCSNKAFAPWALPEGGMVPGILAGCWTGQLLPPPSFPSMRSLNFSTRMEMAGVRVLFGASRLETLVLHVADETKENIQAPQSAEERQALENAAANPEHAELYAMEIQRAQGAQMARMLLGSTCFAGFPYLVRSEVACVYDREGGWRQSKRGRIVKEACDQPWEAMCTEVRKRFLIRKGIDVGPIHLILEVHPLCGMTALQTGATEMCFSSESELVPAQLIPGRAPRPDPRFAPLPVLAAKERFKRGLRVIHVGEQHYGSLGTIAQLQGKGTDESPLLMELRLLAYPGGVERSLAATADKAARRSETWLKPQRVCESLQITPLVLSRLAGSITIDTEDGQHADIGLGLKFARRQLRVAGYTRAVEDQRRPGKLNWQYSQGAVDLFRDFRTTFADLFAGVEAHPNQDKFKLSEIFRSNVEPRARLEELLDWLRGCDSFSQPLVPCFSDILPRTSVSVIEDAAREAGHQLTKLTVAGVGSAEVLLPIAFPPSYNIDGSNWQLGQRVLHLRATGAVPFGLKGTIVGLHQDQVEVVFDEGFLSGSNLQGRCRDFRGYRLPLWALLNLSLKEKLVLKSAAAKLTKGGTKKKKKKKGGKGGGAQRDTSNAFAALMMDA